MKIETKRGPGTTLLELTAEGAVGVGGVEILDLRIWFSGVQISCGGISGVYCNEQFRGRGYARSCMEFALELQGREGKLVSLLFGIPNFYERFGFSVVMPWYGIYVPTGISGTLPSEPRMRDADFEDQRSAEYVYSELVAARVGAVVRDPQTRIKPHKTARWWTHGLMRVLPGKRGEFRGYVWHSELGEEEFEVVEVGASDDETREQILAYLLAEACRRGKQQFVAALPPDDPFALFLRRYDAKFIVVTRASGGGMARILHFRELCSALTPVFRRRLQVFKDDLVPNRLILSVGTSEGIAELGGTGPEARVSACSSSMTKLLFGYWDCTGSLPNGVTSTLPLEVAERLFPPSYPFMYLKDRF
jgi:predicted acetyltransferase